MRRASDDEAVNPTSPGRITAITFRSDEVPP
jgi:hypothetical protein